MTQQHSSETASAKRLPAKLYEIDLAQHDLASARSAQFSRLGNFLAVVPAEGAGKLFKPYNLYGDQPALKPIVLPAPAAWEAAAFCPEPTEPGSKTPPPVLSVACGDDTVLFTQDSVIAPWRELRRLPMPNVCSLAYSYDGQLLA